MVQRIALDLQLQVLQLTSERGLIQFRLQCRLHHPQSEAQHLYDVTLQASARQHQHLSVAEYDQRTTTQDHCQVQVPYVRHVYHRAQRMHALRRVQRFQSFPEGFRTETKTDVLLLYN